LLALGTTSGTRIADQTDHEADGEWRSLTAPNCRQIVAATDRRYVLEVLRLAGSMSVVGNDAEYGHLYWALADLGNRRNKRVFMGASRSAEAGLMGARQGRGPR
jgi:hypothetical protein